MTDKPLSDLLPPPPRPNPALDALLELADRTPGLIETLDDLEMVNLPPRKPRGRGR